MKTLWNRKPHRSPAAIVIPAIIVGATISILGCASTPPPTEQLALTSSAVARASSAGGGEFAAAEMQVAREKLDLAKQAFSAKDYEKARSLAMEAQVDAQLAEAKARSATAKKATDELREGNQVLREEIDRKSK